MTKREEAYDELIQFIRLQHGDYASLSATKLVDLIIDAAKEEMEIERVVLELTQRDRDRQAALDAAIASGNLPPRGEK